MLASHSGGEVNIVSAQSDKESFNKLNKEHVGESQEIKLRKQPRLTSPSPNTEQKELNYTGGESTEPEQV